nr:immunoglobulin light chain junction region [Macaca mulatta]MOX25074.1 immunoglobulin light chain junction region [Macaca mulatta]MOX25250.1 immunoglobulin light chain junction region [Macaca mulatta]MOX98475.1 immunoglobulin light chain junction region [Macaca mulatta]
CMQALDFPHSF